MIPAKVGQVVLNAADKTVIISRKVTAARWTFVIGKEGRIIYRDTEVSPVKDSQEVLDFIRKLDTK